MHLWARINGQYTKEENDFILHLKEQGRDLEKIALEYIKQNINPNYEYQRKFTHGNLECICDILIKNEDQNTYSLYEIKSATDVKQVDEYDMLFQYYVTSQSITVTNIYVIHVNGKYMREGELDLQEAFKTRDLTDLIDTKLEETVTLIGHANEILNKQTPNEIETCRKLKDCPCPQLCFPSLPEYSIYNLANIHQERLVQLEEEGILDINDIPDHFNLSSKQRYQLISTKTRKPIIDSIGITAFISKLNYPLYFLDYEAYSWPVPKYDKHGAYQNVVFQYSLHIIMSNSSEVIHKEYLSTTKNDPIKEVLEHLETDIGDKGTVLVWNRIFEQGCNREMARIYPQYKEMLQNINQRIVDLSDIFSKQMYVDYRFKGSWSLKNVLPILAPGISYKGMSISNGTSAMLKWKELVYNQTSLKEKNAVHENLLRYCELDTYAMIKVLEELYKCINKKLT